MNSEVITDICIFLYQLLPVGYFLARQGTYDESTLGRRSFWSEVFLLFLTLGGSLFLWFLRTTEVLNRKAVRPISKRFQYSTVVFNFAQSVLAIVILVKAPSYVTGADWKNQSAFLLALVGLLTRVWSFEIRRLLKEQKGVTASGLWTFFFGSLYLFIVLRRLFPENSRSFGSDLRKFLLVLTAIPVLMLSALTLNIGWRLAVFSQIQADSSMMQKRIGYWRRVETGTAHYDLVYKVDKDGMTTIYAVYSAESGESVAVLGEEISTKIADGIYYDRIWFSKISRDKVLELSENALAVANSFDSSEILRDERISEEEFNQAVQGFRIFKVASRAQRFLQFARQGYGLYN